MGDIVLAIFALFGLFGIVTLVVGILTKRRWAKHMGITCLLSLAAAWTLGLYALLGGILVGAAAWFLRPASKRHDA